MKKNRNLSGMTIVELAVAMVVASIMIYAGSQLFTLLTKQQRSAEERTLVQTLAIVGNRQIWQDTRSAGHSLNVLKLDDDNGKNFFDQNSEIACGGMPAECMRTFTITESDSKSFLLLTEWNNRRRKVVTFDPSRAYNAVAPNLPYNQDAPLSFNAGELAKTLFTEGICSPSVASDDCGPARGGASGSKLILMKSAGESPQLDGAGIPINNSIKRASSILASTMDLTSESGTIQFLPYPWLNRAHPEDPAQADIANFDHFFRTVPPLGGRAGLVQAYEVKAVRFCIQKPTEGPDKDFYSLYREECSSESGCSLSAACNASADGWSAANDLASRVKKVVFKRPNINMPIIYFEIDTLKSL